MWLGSSRAYSPSAGGGAPAWWLAQSDKSWSTPINTAAAQALGQSWLGDTNVIDPLARSTNSADSGGEPIGIVNAFSGFAMDRTNGYIMLMGCGGHNDYYGNEVYFGTLKVAVPVWSRLHNATAQSGYPGSFRNWPDGRPSSAHTYDMCTSANGRWFACGRSGVNFQGNSVNAALFEFSTTTNDWIDQGNPLTSTASSGNAWATYDAVTDRIIVVTGGNVSPSVRYIRPSDLSTQATNTNDLGDANAFVGSMDTTNRICMISSSDGTIICINVDSTTTAPYTISASGTTPPGQTGFDWHAPSGGFLTYVNGTGVLKGVPSLSGGKYTGVTWSVVSGITGTGPPADGGGSGIWGKNKIITNMGDGRSCLCSMAAYGQPDLYALALPAAGV